MPQPDHESFAEVHTSLISTCRLHERYGDTDGIKHAATAIREALEEQRDELLRNFKANNKTNPNAHV